MTDQPADHGVQMAFLGDVQRVAVIGAEAHVRRRQRCQRRRQSIQILRDRALADQHPHPFLQLLDGLGGGCRLVLGADAGGDIAVQIPPREQWRMTVDMAAGEGAKLFHAGRIAGQNAGIIHEFRQPDHRRMIGQFQQIAGIQPRA